MIQRGKFNEILTAPENIAADVIISGWTFIGRNVKIGKGTKLGNFVHLDSGVQIGANCNIQPSVILNSDTVVENNCFFAGYVSTADELYVSTGEQYRKPCYFEQGCVIGLKSGIISSRIGKNSVVGAMSKVTRDIPPDEVWNGNPAKFLMTRKQYDEKKAKWENNFL